MRIVIIGGNAGGMTAALQVKRRRPDWPITVLEKGNFTSYSSCGIPYYFAGDVGKLANLVVLSPEEIRGERGIDVRTGWEAMRIDLDAKQVVGKSDAGSPERIPYDRLLIATGASPVRPDWEGIGLDGVIALRDLMDAQQMDRHLAGRTPPDKPRRCVIIGSGYIGLEMAESLGRRGLSVVLIERSAGVLGGADPKLTEMVVQELKGRGIEVRLETQVEGFVGHEGRLRAVRTSRGRIPCDLAIVAVGIRPNVELAQVSGIALGETRAIRVDDRQRTGASDVFAAGDCAEAFHLVTGRPAYVPLGLTANRQGRVAGANLASEHPEEEERFPGIVGSAVTRVFDVSIARTGIDEEEADREGIEHASSEVIASAKASYFPGHTPIWVKLLFRTGDRRLLGATLAGGDESVAKRCDIVATALTAGMTVDQLADLDLTYAPPFSPVWDPVLQAANQARFARRTGTASRT